MVDLECETTAADAATPESKFCRLCLEETDLVANLFDKQLERDQNSETLLHERLYDLFQIKYEKSPNMPSNICKKCLQMVDSFCTFRENVIKIESELQKRLTKIMQNGTSKVIDDIPRPGLNGEPGIFDPEEDAIIIEFNPEQDYESSDDDFSMDSETETEDLSNKKLSTLSVPTTTADFTVTTAQSALPTDVQVIDANNTINSGLENQTISVSKKTYTMESAPSNITYSCQYCDMAFSQQDECNEHVNTHDPTGPHVCTFCPMRYVNRQQLISHLRVAHGSERPYICSVCNKGFVRRTDLRKHSIVHTGVRPYTCNVCGKSFSRNTNLTKHIRIHSSYKPHTCVQCPRSFSSPAELMRHSRSHSVIKRKSTTQSAEGMLSQTNQISQSSSGEQSSSNTIMNPTTTSAPLINSEDPYRHSILAAQLQHPRPSLAPPVALPPSSTLPNPSQLLPKTSHYSRNFVCEICSQRFTRERDYQRHQALHLDTLFTCKQCGIGFSRREKLARHELEHHAPQYPCHICRIPFTDSSEFELHMKMHELQQSVALTAQAASLLSAGKLPSFSTSGSQQSQLTAQPFPAMLPPQIKDFYGIQQQRPSVADINFYSQLVPTMNLGFYSETRPEDRNGI